jgi:hypothetical protein
MIVMAPRPAPRGNTEETSEREYQANVNDMVRDTEGEIFADALDNAELDNDGDTSLEEMGDGLEGEVEEEAEPEVDEVDEEQDEGDEDETDDEGEVEDDEVVDDRQDTRRGQQEVGRVPSGRLREETRARQQVEQERDELRRQMAEMNGRMAELSARVNAPQQRQQAPTPAPKPDMFAEPDKYEQWVLEQAEARALEKMDARFQSFEQRQTQQVVQRVDTALNEEARGPRSFEFTAAYNALTSLDPRDPRNRTIVGRVFNAGDRAGEALWDWWDKNGGQEYRDQILEQLSPRQRRAQEREFSREDRGREEPRHVIRQGQRLPSLNSASGSMRSRSQVQDPEMSDGSEESIFRFAARR